MDVSYHSDAVLCKTYVYWPNRVVQAVLTTLALPPQTLPKSRASPTDVTIRLARYDEVLRTLRVLGIFRTESSSKSDKRCLIELCQ